MSWITPRLWRSPRSRFNEDEPLHAAAVYTPDTLVDIAAQGFDAIWMRGRLRELIRGTVFPELNDPLAAQRIESLRTVIAAARATGMRVFLYFNEPLALPRTHPFWARHPGLQGEPHREAILGWDAIALCTSTDEFRAWFRESVGNLFADLPGLGGVILITASEFHSHCWSHRSRRLVGDAFIDKGRVLMACPRCRTREPAEVVGELVRTWADGAATVQPAPEVWVWNWSWSMWYADPQPEMVRALPPGVKLLADFERGGFRDQVAGRVFIDEYALGYAGPSARFLGAREAARAAGLAVCAKIQIGTTHELATVPNLPLIPNLFEKLRGMDALGVAGLMGSWNFGNSPSVNTAAFKLFLDRPDLRADGDAFCRALAASVFGASDPARVTAAWRCFCEAFHEYPFSLKMLYFGPMNFSVAYPLLPGYTDRKMGPTWEPHGPFGDRLEDCLGPFSLDQVVACMDRMEVKWREGLALYGEASAPERACAEMIGLHLQASRGIFRFHQWRRARMAALELSGPCVLAADAEIRPLLAEHEATLRAAARLAAEQPAFGYHQEPGVSFYDAASIEAARARMLREWGKADILEG